MISEKLMPNATFCLDFRLKQTKSIINCQVAYDIQKENFFRIKIIFI